LLSSKIIFILYKKKISHFEERPEEKLFIHLDHSITGSVFKWGTNKENKKKKKKQKD